MEQKLVLIAIGGNALLRPNEKGTIEEQEGNAQATADQLLPFLKPEYNIVVTHGNGPQVGNILLQNEIANETIPAMPLDVCVGQSQGSIGYFMQQGLMNTMEKHGIKREVTTLLTQVEVDPNDAAFKNPTKPVGKFYTEEQAKVLMTDKGWSMVEDARRGWRRVVPSPKPVYVLQKYTVRDLANSGHVIITVGGGGIPVMKKDGRLKGIEAVIDKDLASANLAAQIKADVFMVLTAVPQVCLNFNKPNEKKLDRVSMEEAMKYLEEGHFAPGSMKPKIEACINYLRDGGKEAIITDPETMALALEGKGGTVIYR